MKSNKKEKVVEEISPMLHDINLSILLLNLYPNLTINTRRKNNTNYTNLL